METEKIREWLGFETRLRYIELKGKIVNKEPLHVGVGRTKDKLATSVDLPVITIIKDGKEVVYIPGSTLKGIFRSASTMITRREKKSKYKKLCSGVGRDSCGNDSLSFIDPLEEGEKVTNALQRALYNFDRPRVYEILWKHYCLMCKIYGGMSYRSHVYISDAYSNSSTRLVKTGIAINRRSGTAASGALYQVEFVPPGVEFDFRLTGINLPNYAIGLIFKTIDLINEGVYKIGGLKSKGFGLVEIRDLVLVFDGDGSPLDELDAPVNITKGTYVGNKLENVKREFIDAWVKLDEFP